MHPLISYSKVRKKQLKIVLPADRKPRNKFNVSSVLSCIAKTVVGERESYLIYQNLNNPDLNVKIAMQNL